MDVGKLYETLKEEASHQCWCDDKGFSICDFSGGNIDDAYYGGCRDGESLLARDLLKIFFPDRD